MKSSKVIVAGGGPSGAFAGYLLASKGYQVTILDKAIFPRYKSCGGGVLAKTKELLPLNPKWIKSEFDTFILSYNYQAPIQSTAQLPFVMMVNREDFDYELVKLAVNAGADFNDGVRIDSAWEEENGIGVRTDRGKVYTGKYLIVADGACSRVARSLALPNYSIQHGSALEGEYIVSSANLEKYGQHVHLNYGHLSSGYSWIFPKGDYLSIGVGTFEAKYPQLRSKMEEYLKKLGIEIKQTLQLRGGIVPIGGINRVFSGKRVFLVGDAAGLVDPLTGEGIYYALKSSGFAVETLLAIEEGKGNIKDYDKHVDVEIGTELRYALQVAKFCFSNSALAHQILQSDPELVNVLQRTLAGQNSYSTFLKKFFWRMPKTLIKSVAFWR